MEKRITCKVHDDQERVIKVGVEGEGILQMLDVWNRITNDGEIFFTEEGRRATVRAVERNGTKYLTTSPDGITPNNLDELPSCQ